MQGRPDQADSASRRSRRSFDSVLDRMAGALPGSSGLMGACGVAVSAAAAHAGGGSLVATAGMFLILHAATSLALSAHAAQRGRLSYALAAWLLLVGTGLFAGDLVLAGLWNVHPLPIAAPIGGLMMIAGWLTVPAASIIGVIRG